LPITFNVPLRNTPSGAVKLQDQYFKIQNVEELGNIVSEFNNIALTTLEGAYNPNAQAQIEDQASKANVDR